MTSTQSLTRDKAMPDDAVRLARNHYLALERVDMQSLAAELAISRTTLYRWVGDRDSLISGMLSEMVTEVIRDAIDSAEGEGIDRTIDGMRRFTETSASFAPLRHLVRTEPELALRVMIAPGARVSKTISEELRQNLEVAYPDWGEAKTAELADVIIQVGMAYIWGNIATDSEPDVGRALRAMRLLLDAAERP